MSKETPVQRESGEAAHPGRTEAARVIALLDLTDLDDQHRVDGIEELVRRAVEHGVAAVCVWPEFVATVADRLRDLGGSDVRIATVVNFPSGDSDLSAVVVETTKALVDGAQEIDLVLPYGALLAGDDDTARQMVVAIAELVHGAGMHLKVILETGELRDDGVITAASRLAIDSGADFIKSSTGKTAVSATRAAVAAMVEVIASTGGAVGLKPSGGIRSVADAAGYLELVERRLGAGWATPDTFRFGASSLLDDALAVLAT